MVTLSSYLAAPNPQIAFFCLTSKTWENWWSGFLALGFFYCHVWDRWHWTVVNKSLSIGYYDWFNDNFILTLLITFSSRFYNFFMFSVHLCSYISLLLNYWYTPMVTIFCFGRSYFNNPLRTTHFCSNYSISIIGSITLVDALDLSYCTAWADFQSIWKQRYYFPYGGSFRDVVGV